MRMLTNSVLEMSRGLCPSLRIRFSSLVTLRSRGYLYDTTGGTKMQYNICSILLEAGVSFDLIARQLFSADNVNFHRSVALINVIAPRLGQDT